MWPATIFRQHQSEIPRSSATSWERWASVSGHKPPSSSPLWTGQRARGRSRAAGTPHVCLWNRVKRWTDSY